MNKPILLTITVSVILSAYAEATPGSSGKQLFERTVIKSASQPVSVQASDECTVFENWIESVQKQGDSAPVVHRLLEAVNVPYYQQSLLDLRAANFSLDAGGNTGLTAATEYGMLAVSTDPSQEYDLLLIEQMTPDSKFYTLSPRREEWKAFIEDKCDRAKTAPVVAGS